MRGIGGEHGGRRHDAHPALPQGVRNLPPCRAAGRRHFALFSAEWCDILPKKFPPNHQKTRGVLPCEPSMFPPIFP